MSIELRIQYKNIMTEKEYFDLLQDDEKCRLAITRWTLFCQWQVRLYVIENELFELCRQNKVDGFAQEMFYIKLYGYLTEGNKYIANFQQLDAPYLPFDVNNIIMRLREEIYELRQAISNDEYITIEYRRHTASHLFQPKYDYNCDVLSKHKKMELKKIQKLRNQQLGLETIYDRNKYDDIIDFDLIRRLHPIFQKYLQEHNYLLKNFDTIKKTVVISSIQ